MKRFFYHYNLSTFNIFLQIVISVFFLSFDAKASSLKISTNQACNFLKEQGLKAQLSWKKNDENIDQWGCANKLSSSEIDAPLSFTYQATGNEKEVKNILDTFNDKPFIFNLGHGILPQTPIENVELILKIIRRQ